MYVIPSDFYDSLMKRAHITEDPLLTTQVKLEEQKSKILRKKQNPDKKLAEFIDLSHSQNIVDEQQINKDSKSREIVIEPTVPQLAPKKPGKPSKTPKAPYFEYQFGTGSKKKTKKSIYPNGKHEKHDKNTLLNHFYDYEPKGKSIKFMKTELPGIKRHHECNLVQSKQSG